MGSVVKPRSLKTRNWTFAAQMRLEAEAGVKRNGQPSPSKKQSRNSKLSNPTLAKTGKRKIKLLTGRLKTFLENVASATLPR
jgi:hypothetical protein